MNLDQLKEKYETVTLGSVTLENGCIARDTQPIFSLAKAVAGKASERNGFELYTLIIDDEHIRTNSRTRMEKALQSVIAGTRFRVFRNAGKGATIKELP